MRQAERVAIYGVLAVVAAVVALGTLGSGPGHAAATAGARREPPAARIATCDVFEVVQKLVESDRYAPARKAEEDKMKAELQPLVDELQAIDKQLQGADPKDEKAQALYKDFQTKRTAAGKKQQQLSQDLQAFATRQIVEAYELVRTSADAVAERDGYTHVIASRRKNEKLTADDAAAIVQGLLQRPVLHSPKNADITDEVMADLKLS